MNIKGDFFRGARIKPPPSSREDLTLGDCILCTLDVRARHYKDVDKEYLLRLISSAWDAYEEASKVKP